MYARGASSHQGNVRESLFCSCAFNRVHVQSSFTLSSGILLWVLFYGPVLRCGTLARHFQVVERGVDDSGDAHNYSVGSEGHGQPAYTPTPRAPSFDGDGDGSGGAQGTRRSLRLDGGSAAGRATTASGVAQRRPRAFDGVEHDLLGAWAAAQAERLLAGAAAAHAAAERAALASAAAVERANATALAACAVQAEADDSVPAAEQAACAAATAAVQEAVARDTLAQAAAAAALALSVEAAAARAELSDAAQLHRGTHRPGRVSFYIKVNHSDAANPGVPYEDAGQRRRGHSWGGLVALHSADYGQRSGFDARGDPSATTRREGQRARNGTSGDGGGSSSSSSAAARSSSSSDPFEAFGYFASPGADWSLGASSGAFGEPPPGGGRGGNLGAARRPCASGVACPSDRVQNDDDDVVADSLLASDNATHRNGTNATATSAAAAAAARRRRVGERMPRVLVGVSVGADMRHGTDFLVAPDELVHPVAPSAVDPASALRRTASGAAHATSSGDALGGLPVFHPHVQQRRWYKVDVFLDWRRGLYTVKKRRGHRGTWNRQRNETNVGSESEEEKERDPRLVNHTSSHVCNHQKQQQRFALSLSKSSSRSVLHVHMSVVLSTPP
jgi:hypothetical protein